MRHGLHPDCSRTPMCGRWRGDRHGRRPRCRASWNAGHGLLPFRSLQLLWRPINRPLVRWRPPRTCAPLRAPLVAPCRHRVRPARLERSRNGYSGQIGERYARNKCSSPGTTTNPDSTRASKGGGVTARDLARRDRDFASSSRVASATDPLPWSQRVNPCRVEGAKKLEVHPKWSRCRRLRRRDA